MLNRLSKLRLAGKPTTVRSPKILVVPDVSEVRANPPLPPLDFPSIKGVVSRKLPLTGTVGIPNELTLLPEVREVSVRSWLRTIPVRSELDPKSTPGMPNLPVELPILDEPDVDVDVVPVRDVPVVPVLDVSMLVTVLVVSVRVLSTLPLLVEALPLPLSTATRPTLMVVPDPTIPRTPLFTPNLLVSTLPAFMSVPVFVLVNVVDVEEPPRDKEESKGRLLSRTTGRSVPLVEPVVWILFTVLVTVVNEESRDPLDGDVPVVLVWNIKLRPFGSSWRFKPAVGKLGPSFLGYIVTRKAIG